MFPASDIIVSCDVLSQQSHRSVQHVPAHSTDMAANALEEKINKIRQQNEEIRRRHEEVEEDKKNAAKLNALVQMVPSTDWPERKEPPDFSNTPRTNTKPKSAKEHHEPPQQYHSTGGEGRKVHIFAQGQGPPPDPKYNFLADAEREEGNVKSTKEGNNPQNRGQKHTKGTFRRKPGGKDGMQRDYRTNKGSHRDEHQPEYEAWRAERNRIDEDRISRQRTAEGNWRREWDNDKAHIVDEMMRPEAKLGDYAKKDHKDFDRRYHVNGNDYANHNRSGNRSYRGNSRHFHNNYENRSNNTYHQDGHGKNSASTGSDERTVVATDKSIKVTLNQGNMMKGPVMSVKVNSPSIAGTGRVGPRQRSRVTYSSHSDVEVASPDSESFSRPKSYEDKTKGIYHDNLQKSPNSRKSQPPKKKDFSNKSPYFRKKEMKRENANENPQKHHETEISRREYKESQELYRFKPEKQEEDAAKPLKDDKIVTANEKESDVNYSDEPDVNNIEMNEQDNQNLNSHTDKENEVCANKDDESALQNSDLSESKVEMEIEIYKTSEKVENKSDESQVIQAISEATSECETTQTDLTDVKDVDDNDRSEIKSVENPTYDEQNEEQNLSIEQTEEIISNNCDNKQSEDTNEEENDVKCDTGSVSPKEEQTDEVIIPSPTDINFVAEEDFAVEEDNKPESDDEVSKKIEISVVEDGIATADEQIETSNKQDVTKCTDETQERTSNNDDEEKSSAGSNVVVDTIESPEKDLQIENEKAAPSTVIETVT
ncbi:myb-like protein X isoform X2 [Linepithema humile]|uniref:myb-like protein X isoform X2 n=1 Tax=Linepithema humile TaxID=83485 RepID=UPI0006236984|nr:PREDICTED: enolase-phosphatase E1-like isoform X2 [Linepithema humile]